MAWKNYMKLDQNFVASSSIQVLNIFFFSFNTHKLTMVPSYSMPSFDSFTKILMVEQTKLMNTGILKYSKSKALVSSKGNQRKRSNKWCKSTHGMKIKGLKVN